MMSRWQCCGPVSGLLLCVTWAPMAIVIPRLPDLGSAQGVQAFWHANLTLMQTILLSVSVGYLFLLLFLGALIELLRRLSGAGALAWTAFAGALMFMTALNVALGLATAGGLLVERDPASTYALHTAGFLLAAPAAFAGAAFFAAVAAITRQTRALPGWLGWLAIVGVVANGGAVFGTLSLTGPLNSGNGIVGGIAAPLGLYLAWIFAFSLWWLRASNRIKRSAAIGMPTESTGAR